MSPTQQVLSPETVSRLVREATGAEVLRAEPLSGGTFAVVWRVDLAAAPSLVLKVGPAPDVRVLRYEAGMVAAEADYLRRVAAQAPSVLVPRVVASGSGGDVGGGEVAGEWVLTTFLPGATLPEIEGRHGTAAGVLVREEVGAALGALHRAGGDRFGYTGERPHGATWSEAMTAIIEALLADAVDWGVDLGSVPERLRAALGRCVPLLDEVDRPVLLHWDLWDGNVLAAPDAAGRHRLTGIVDGERFVLGDPLVDLVSPLLGRRIEDEPDHPLLAGYAAATGVPLVLDGSAHARLALYRAWLYLVMTVEVPSRGLGADVERARLVAWCLEQALTDLGV